MPPKPKHWGKESTAEVTRQFNLFTESGGAVGWDPRNVKDGYIKSHAQQNNKLRPFLAANLGGDSGNSDSSKIIRGYRRCATDYLEDQALSGKRKATGRSGEEEEDAEDVEFEEEEDEVDDTDMAPKKKGSSKPKVKGPPTPSRTAKAKASNNDARNDPDVEVKDLAAKMKTGMELSSVGIVDMWVFTDPDTNVRYAAICVELCGLIEGKMLKSKFDDDGTSITITCKYQRGGQLTNPDHLVSLYGEGIKTHPIYIHLKELNRFHLESVEEEEEKSLVIELPFPCNTAGFYDPIRDDDSQVSLGTFPLPHIRAMLAPAPAPSTKLLHLICEELKKEKKKQAMVEECYFTAPPQAQGSS